MRHPAALLLAGAFLGCAPRLSAPATPPLGCYRADRLLGTSFTGEPERGDTAWAYYRLEAEGGASRPMLGRRARFWDRNHWRLQEDTLHVRLFTGLVGWDLALTSAHEAGRYAGVARYMSDAIVRGADPLRAPVRVQLAACPLLSDRGDR